MTDELDKAGLEAARNAYRDALRPMRTLRFSADDAGAMQAAIRAYLAVADGWRPSVKPLEWVSEPPYLVARAFTGRYVIEKWDGESIYDVTGTYLVSRGKYTTLDAAKAAVHADYEARRSLEGQ